MKKILTLFKRDMEGNRQVYDEVAEGAEWVAAGEGRATRKWDGTACLVRDGKLYKRYTLRRGKAAPEHFEPATEVDPNTGKQEGWVPVGDGPEDRCHRQAWLAAKPFPESTLCVADGTYELLGPNVQGNPEQFIRHGLMLHGKIPVVDAPREFNALRAYFCGIEGIVWHHADGRMVKLKGKDFGIKRPVGVPT